MKIDSGNANVLCSSSSSDVIAIFVTSETLTRCILGWYLCMEFSTIYKNKGTHNKDNTESINGYIISLFASLLKL